MSTQVDRLTLQLIVRCTNEAGAERIAEKLIAHGRASAPFADAAPSDQILEEAAEAYEACNPHLASRPDSDAIRSAWIAGYWQAKAQMSATPGPIERLSALDEAYAADPDHPAQIIAQQDAARQGGASPDIGTSGGKGPMSGKPDTGDAS